MMRIPAARAWIVVSVLALGIFVYDHWLNALPEVSIPAFVLPSPNGRDALHAAYKQMKIASFLRAAAPQDYVDDVVHLSLATKRSLVASNAAALRACLSALELSCWKSVDRLAATDGHEFDEIEALAELLFLDADVKTSEGDFVGAAESDTDALRLATRLRPGGEIDVAAEANKIETIAGSRLWPLVARMDASDAAALGRRLQTIAAQRFSFANSMEQEKWMLQAEMARKLRDQSLFSLLTEDVLTRDDNSTYSPTDPAMAPSHRMFEAYKAGLTENKRGYYAEYSALLSAFVAAAGQPFSVVAAGLPKGPLCTVYGLDINTFLEGLIIDERTVADSDLLRCVLAIKVYRARHGANPGALKDLVADGELDRVPDDPFAPGGPTPLRYKRVGASYLLYSVGPNGLDDGGKPIGLSIDYPHGQERLEPGDVAVDDAGDWVAWRNVGGPSGK